MSDDDQGRLDESREASSCHRTEDREEPEASEEDDSEKDETTRDEEKGCLAAALAAMMGTNLVAPAQGLSRQSPAAPATNAESANSAAPDGEAVFSSAQAFASSVRAAAMQSSQVAPPEVEAEAPDHEARVAAEVMPETEEGGEQPPTAALPGHSRVRGLAAQAASLTTPAPSAKIASAPTEQASENEADPTEATDVVDTPDTSEEAADTRLRQTTAPLAGGMSRGREAGAEPSRREEKNAAFSGTQSPTERSSGENKFLNVEGKGLADSKASGGTDVAMQGATMKPPFPMTSRVAQSANAQLGGDSLGGETQGDAGGTSFTWKGWTNGGGERSSTAAQFSRLTEHSPATHGSAFGVPTVSARTVAASTGTAEVATPVRAFPADETALMAPIGSAIERLVVNGKEQLSLTVRFEQGGTLSLKLAMREGEIATQIQTDVPGLENALRSAWSQFAADWQGRGLKLGDPDISGGSQQQQQKSSQDPASSEDQQEHASGRQFVFEGTGTPAFDRNGRRLGTRSATGAADGAVSTTATVTPARGTLRILKTWA